MGRRYALRHTFATNARAAGVPRFDVARYMGTSLAMIDRTYGQLVHGSEELARQARLVRGADDAFRSRLETIAAAQVGVERASAAKG